MAYGRDLADRLLLPRQRPDVWCAITVSGLELSRVFLDTFDKLDSRYSEVIDFWSVGRQKKTKRIIRFGVPKAEANDFAGLRGRHVFIIDSAIHSGETFSAVHDRIAAAKPASIATYSLVVKRSSCFYPTYWGCTIADSDRAYFLLDRIPNNRLSTGRSDHGTKPYWSFKRLEKADCSRSPVCSGLKSIDGMSWSDRHYGMLTNENGLATYLCEVGSQIAGFLTFHYEPGRTFVVDEVAVDRKWQGKGLGGTLVRFADTLARQSSLPRVKLWAIANKTKFYRKYGYKPIIGEPKVWCGDEEFQPMVKVGLYRTYFEPG